MKAFDVLGQDGCFSTHLVISGLNPAVSLHLPLNAATPSDVVFSDAPSTCWPARRSLRHLLTLSYPAGIAPIAGAGAAEFCKFELFGEEVKPLDLGSDSCRWQTDVIDLLPGEKIATADGQDIQNSTSFGVRVGFVHDAAELRKLECKELSLRGGFRE